MSHPKATATETPLNVKASSSVLDMSMSLDGYIADENDFLGGADGERLHKWAASKDAIVEGFENEWKAAGAVLSGRRTAELMDHWGGTSGGIPIFVFCFCLLCFVFL